MIAPIGRRRSERFLMDVPVVVRGQSPDHGDFREETFTVSVSAHGALVMLAANVALGQELVVINPKNEGEQSGRVAYRGRAHAGLAQVGIEFPRAVPEFWQLPSLPENWKGS